jgi:hypothetical protein
MPIFITITGPLGVTSFMADSLKNDPGVPGNLLAANISDLPVSLPNGRVFLPSVWSFRASDLMSYMVGEYADATPPIFDMLAGMAEATGQVEEALRDEEDVSVPAAPPRKKSRR